ncbi:hypothetical protein B0T25DRAFT_567007 [Lasiosphaeria hispida]|uniref:Uncharacterized protein n=1 Tax=Lasiosphaeria hispida TaxID=260671 RepID=A0AAJ0HNC5_9PEZI|nr:hypothetical protein B0T25DRAFT_567007 [Lasiosphaeria hispida]
MATVRKRAMRRGATPWNGGLLALRRLILTLLVIPGLLTRGRARAIASALDPSNPSNPVGSLNLDGCGPMPVFLYPTQGLDLDLTFHFLDAINVTYRSSFARPILSCWCGEPGRATEKLRVDNATPFGNELVILNFSSSDPCWFHISDSGECGDAVTSATFILSPDQRPRTPTTPTLLSALLAARAPRSTPTPTPTPTLTATPIRATGSPGPLPSTTASSTTTPAPGAVALGSSQDPRGGGQNLSPGAIAGLSVGIVIVCVAVGAMAAFLYFRRRRKGQDADLASAIINHDRAHGRNGPEKALTMRNESSSVTSGRSDEALCPIQPVFDGFPGSMGYDDVRSLHSTTDYHHSDYHHSPHSPNPSHNGPFWGSERSIERDELSAARLNSQPILTSYGPNPVTPTLTPRPSSLNIRSGNISTDSREGIPPMPLVPSYASYSIPPPSSIPEPSPSPPRKLAAPPIVVSYGPNRVTPTPAVTSPTVPPDETIFKRRAAQSQAQPQVQSQPQPQQQHQHHYQHQQHQQQHHQQQPHHQHHHQPSPPTTHYELAPSTSPSQHHPRPLTSHDRQFSWEAADDDEPLASSLMSPSSHGPLPPYASTADFFAMEKGAIRKLAEPQAEAELPPTKDGFYHYASDFVEYELPGTAPQNEPQLPYHLGQYRRQNAEAGPSGPGTSASGGGGPSGGGLREIDEQKFLLEGEVLKMRAQKVRAMKGEVERDGKGIEGGR